MMAFGLGCFSCCQGCDPCDAACPNDDQNPAGFEVVHGGNTTDGFLTWNNPSDYARTLVGSFTLPSGDFPCYLRLNIWKGVTSVPVEGEPDLTTNMQVRITCLQGKVSLGFVELNAGESVQFGGVNDPPATYWLEGGANFPTVDGLDSTQHIDNEPQWWNYGVTALCAGSEVWVSASLSWDGVGTGVGWELYGHLLECWERLPPGDPGDCLDCDGTPTPAPETVYLTISNFDGGGAKDYNANDVDWDGTYAIPLIECVQYSGPLSLAVSIPGSPPLALYVGGTATTPNPAGGLWVLLNAFRSDFGSGGGLQVVRLAVNLKPEWSGDASELLAALCGDTPLTGSMSGVAWQESWYPFNMTTYTASFDWELSW